MAPRTVFFDYGGTLVHTGPSAEGIAQFRNRTWGSLLAEHSLTRTVSEIDSALETADRGFGAEIYQYLGRTDEYWRQYNDLVMDRLEIREGRDALQAALSRALPSLGELYPETRAVLEELRGRGLKLGVISNHNDSLRSLLVRHRISEFFDTVTYSQEAGAEKPDARVFQLALRRADCAPREAVHIGDSWEADVLGARGVGIRPIWIDRARRGGRSGCTQIHTLSEGLTFLEADSP